MMNITVLRLSGRAYYMGLGSYFLNRIDGSKHIADMGDGNSLVLGQQLLVTSIQGPSSRTGITLKVIPLRLWAVPGYYIEWCSFTNCPSSFSIHASP